MSKYHMMTPKARRNERNHIFNVSYDVTVTRGLHRSPTLQILRNRGRGKSPTDHIWVILTSTHPSMLGHPRVPHNSSCRGGSSLLDEYRVTCRASEASRCLQMVIRGRDKSRGIIYGPSCHPSMFGYPRVPLIRRVKVGIASYMNMPLIFRDIQIIQTITFSSDHSDRNSDRNSDDLPTLMGIPYTPHRGA